MTLRLGKVRALWLAAVLTIICLAAVISIAVGREYAAGEPRPVTVMTRNIYLGADINRPIRAALDRTGREAVLALGHANHQLREVVTRTDFATRSNLLAAEIAATRPDLIGLQEVALWRHGPMQLDQLGRPNATQIGYDFLAILLADLTNRGVTYEIVRIQQESDVEAPAFTGNPYAGTAGSPQDVRLTDRDVILVRSGSGLRIEGTGGGQFRQRFEVRLGGTTFHFVRGYTWVDVAAGSARVRFVNTHLESQSSQLARAQAEELLNGPAGDTSLSTVIACDCNSNPASIAARTGLPLGSGAAYRLITDGYGFSDLWLQQPDRDEPGNTAWLSELVNDEAPDLERRIDLILARSASPGQIVANRVEVTGDELSDRDTVSKLWPSDHAGVLVELRIG
ncbi:MAG TPA: endonuclease/exonuclease/phosphatase family protein [Propionibacteriaceae bacterium]|nr:endonuclease/exonuclease/phosphatase family protein [Propionibacteriaceae bacterium]